MRRRAFLSGSLVALVAPLTLAVLILLPLLVSAQRQPGILRIGYLKAYPSLNDPSFAAFRKQLQELGHVEDKTVAIGPHRTARRHRGCVIVGADALAGGSAGRVERS